MTRRSAPAVLFAAALAVLLCGGCSQTDAPGGTTPSPLAPAAHNQPPSDASPGPGRATGPAAVTVFTGRLGPVLTDADGRTLYTPSAIGSSEAVCDDTCESAWPPLLTGGPPRARDGASDDLLDSLRRSDGRLQVTYDGRPLYRYGGDIRPGDARGQELDQLGLRWSALTPSGLPVEGR